jgi:hypothetical protein
MQYQALASLAFEVGETVGDTDTGFLTRINRYLNNRYDDALLRSGATTWTGASLASLGAGDIPTLGMGKVIREGATADAFYAKRQFAKAQVFEQKYEFALANFIQSGDYNNFNISMARYDNYV